MIRSWKIKTAPVSDPFDLTETKQLLDVDPSDTNDDKLILMLGKAATNLFEEYTGRKLITQSWHQYLSDWPEQQDEIEIIFPPLISVVAVKYYNEAGQASTFAAGNYTVDNSSEPGKIVLLGSATWPSEITLRDAQGIEIEFTCGYGDKFTSVPVDMRAIIMFLVARWFHNRQELGTMPDEIKMMIDARRILSI